MKYFENGFYETQNDKNSRIELTDEQWEELIDKQSQGFDIIVENGQVIAREHVETKKDKIQKLQSLLEKTDYVVSKLAEMQITNNENFSSELARYQPTIQNRVAWRLELDRLLNE